MSTSRPKTHPNAWRSSFSALRLVAASIPLALGAAVAGCTSVSAKGVVRTPDGRPVTGATLTLRSGESGRPGPSRSPGPNGCFNVFTAARGQEWGILLVEAPGYKPLDWRLPPARENLLLVTLAPISAADASTALPVTAAERGTLYATPCEPEVRGNAISLH